MIIRALTENDTDALQKIRLESLINSPGSFGSSFEEESKHDISIYKNRILAKSNYFYGAFINEEIIGIICLSTNDRCKLKHRAYIKSVFVSENYRNKGIAKKLINTALEKAIDLKFIEQIELTVVTDKLPAILLYNSYGFEIYATKAHAIKIDGKYYNEYLMMKKLYEY